MPIIEDRIALLTEQLMDPALSSADISTIERKIRVLEKQRSVQ